jgi:hypothetical protein
VTRLAKGDRVRQKVGLGKLSEIGGTVVRVVERRIIDSAGSKQRVRVLWDTGIEGSYSGAQLQRED